MTPQTLSENEALTAPPSQGVTEQGLAAIVKTRGNPDVHVILRGSSKGPNYAAEHVQAAAASVKKSRPKAHPSIMIDCSRKFRISQLSHFA